MMSIFPNRVFGLQESEPLERPSTLTGLSLLWQCRQAAHLHDHSGMNIAAWAAYQSYPLSDRKDALQCSLLWENRLKDHLVPYQFLIVWQYPQRGQYLPPNSVIFQ